MSSLALFSVLLVLLMQKGNIKNKILLQEKQTSKNYIKLSEGVSQNNKDTSLNTFYDKRWNISVDFKQNSIYEIDSTRNTPDSGITLFLDKDTKKNKLDEEFLSIYGCVGYIMVPAYKDTKKELFITNQNINGYLYTTKNKTKEGYTDISLILGNGFIGAHGFCKNDDYKENEILDILKTIQVYNKSNTEFTPTVYSEDKLNN